MRQDLKQGINMEKRLCYKVREKEEDDKSYI